MGPAKPYYKQRLAIIGMMRIGIDFTALDASSTLDQPDLKSVADT
jgi:hypothetical protein